MTGDQDGNTLNEMGEESFLIETVTQSTREENILDQVLVTDPASSCATTMSVKI